MARGCRELTSLDAAEAARWSPSLTPTGRSEGVVAAAADLTGSVPELGVDIPATLDWACRLGALLLGTGAPSPTNRWEVLATAAATDVAAARVLEPHLDALTILGEADAGGLSGDDEAWGVFAAEAAGARLTATARNAGDGGWTLTGVKPWCSLAATLDRALVTA